MKGKQIKFGRRRQHHNHGVLRGSTQELKFFRRDTSDPTQDGIHLNGRGLTVLGYAIYDAMITGQC